MPAVCTTGSKACTTINRRFHADCTTSDAHHHTAYHPPAHLRVGCQQGKQGSSICTEGLQQLLPLLHGRHQIVREVVEVGRVGIRVPLRVASCMPPHRMLRPPARGQGAAGRVHVAAGSQPGAQHSRWPSLLCKMLVASPLTACTIRFLADRLVANTMMQATCKTRPTPHQTCGLPSQAALTAGGGMPQLLDVRGPLRGPQPSAGTRAGAAARSGTAAAPAPPACPACTAPRWTCQEEPRCSCCQGCLRYRFWYRSRFWSAWLPPAAGYQSAAGCASQGTLRPQPAARAACTWPGGHGCQGHTHMRGRMQGVLPAHRARRGYGQQE